MELKHGLISADDHVQEHPEVWTSRMRVSVESLLSSKRIEAQRRQIDITRGASGYKQATAGTDTEYVAAADAQGNLVSFIQSNFMVEYTDETDAGLVEIHRGVSPWQNVIQIGDDIKKGELVFPRGRRLRAHELFDEGIRIEKAGNALAGGEFSFGALLCGSLRIGIDGDFFERRQFFFQIFPGLRHRLPRLTGDNTHALKHGKHYRCGNDGADLSPRIGAHRVH